MERIAVLCLLFIAIAVGLMGCGGGGGGEGGGGGSPTPAPPATPTPPPGPPTTTVTTTAGPENIPNPFCGKNDELSKPRAAIPPVGSPIGWNPTGASVGPAGAWCKAEVPKADFNLKDYCGTSNLKTNGTIKAAAGPEIKVLTYNLYWWNLYGQRHGNSNSAGKNMANFAKDKAYDLFGFQECEDMNLVLQGMKDAGITTKYSTYSIGEGYVNVCMGYATDVFTEQTRGRQFVAEDQAGKFHYGKRVAHWIRLKHKASGKMVLFVNHHGPTPPNTGGMCGSKATAYQLVKVIAQNAKVGDSVILVGDFNAPMQMNMGKGNEWQQEAGVLACHIPHVFAAPTPEAMWAVDNFYSTCTNLKKGTQMERGGSDHFAFNAVFELTGPSLADGEARMVV